MSDTREGMDQRTNPVKAIREKCLDCCCGAHSEVDKCAITQCQLWPFRYGRNPYRAKRVLTAEQKERARGNLLQGGK
jgi:hypothetical protein